MEVVVVDFCGGFNDDPLYMIGEEQFSLNPD